MAEPLVVVSSSHLLRHCHGVAARLSNAGIPAVIGRQDDVLPLGAPRFTVRVPRALASAATRCVSAAGEGAYRTAAAPEAGEEPLPDRRRRLAAFFAFGLAFGLGHVYAREYVAGLILGLGQAACLLLASIGVPEVLFAFPALMVLDAWGALRAVDRENEGRRREPVAQLAAALPAVALVLAGATAVIPAPAAEERPLASAAR